MRRRKLPDAVKYIAVTAIAVSATAFFFLHREAANGNGSLQALMKPQVTSKGAGYKEEDRRRLERLIHEGSKDD